MELVVGGKRERRKNAVDGRELLLLGRRSRDLESFLFVAMWQRRLGSVAESWLWPLRMLESASGAEHVPVQEWRGPMGNGSQ